MRQSVGDERERRRSEQLGDGGPLAVGLSGQAAVVPGRNLDAYGLRTADINQDRPVCVGSLAARGALVHTDDYISEVKPSGQKWLWRRRQGIGVIGPRRRLEA